MDKPEFHLEEYKMLREEILQDVREIYRTEVLAAVAGVSVYTWLMSHNKTYVPYLAWFIPPFVLLVSIARCADRTFRITTIGRYLKSTEKVVFKHDASLLGWEHYKASRPWIGRSSVIIATVVWTIVFMASVMVSCRLSHTNTPTDNPPPAVAPHAAVSSPFVV